MQANGEAAAVKYAAVIPCFREACYGLAQVLPFSDNVRPQKADENLQLRDKFVCFM